ncbi:hypothetical protein [Paraburkholderia hospita]|uniref:hypothetical protein n=1 Tax=Paraburkholderia hospita TaxID=169430 RepID=UPI001FC93DE0|nr:hypothetical protein [Paraburkholderia hospita]
MNPKDWRLLWNGPRTRLRAPRAAAIAGIVFSVLLIACLLLLRRSVPDSPLDAGRWLLESSGTVAVAVNLVPFAGIAFLWFIGVLRDRLGDREDRCFTTCSWGVVSCSWRCCLWLLRLSAGLWARIAFE